MPTPREIQINVTDADGNPIENATVFALTVNGQNPQARTNAAGQALLQLPADDPCAAIAAFKEAVGFDYRLVWKPHEIRTDPFHLPPDLPQPVNLVLDGAQTVQVRVRDREGRPLAGAKVGPLNIARNSRGGYPFSLFDTLHRAANAEGIATFDFIPRDLFRPNHFTARMDGWKAADIAVLDDDQPQPLLEITLVPLVPVTGRACDAAGAPVEGATIHASAAGYHFVHSEYQATTATDGTFTLHLPADRLCVAFARHDTRASLVQTRVVHDTPPAPFELTLGPAPHLSGQVTAGAERTPLAHAQVSIEYGFDLNTEKGIRDKLPGESVLLHPTITLELETDAHGNFDLFTAPGEYSVECECESQKARRTADVTLAEVWIALHLETRDTAPPPISGRIVAPGQNTPIPFAWVTTWPLAQYVAAGRGTADADGSFTLPLPPTPFILLAGSPDHQFVGLLHLSSADEPITLSLGPATHAVGRLLRHDGTPVANEQLWCDLLVRDPRYRRGSSISTRARTDNDGRFTFRGLLPGQQYKVQHLGANRKWTQLPNFETNHPGEHSLGDLTLPSP